MKLIFVFLIMLCCRCYSQDRELNSFLTALRTPTFDLSAKTIDSFKLGSYEIPVVASHDPVTGSFFTSDTENIKGYRAVVLCKAQTKEGSFVEKMFYVTMFKDKQTGRWKIIYFRDGDPIHEANVKMTDDLLKYYEDGKMRYLYRSEAYWNLAAGNLAKAYILIQKAKDTARQENDSEFTDDDCLLTLSKII